MKRILICAVSIAFLTIEGCSLNKSVENTSLTENNNRLYMVTIKRDILCLMMAYPGYIINIEKNENGMIYVIMKSGKRVLYDDKKEKTGVEKMADPDIQDMMEQIYPLKNENILMPQDFDPGRVRVYAILNEVYGSFRTQVESNLVNVKTNYGSFQFNKNNKASEELQKAFNDVSLLVRNNHSISVSLLPVNGTFNYRFISGTQRLSPHSFGIAIDLARDKRDYWRWASREQGQKRIESYPEEIVYTFEKHNFIWGGKWGHFDILHFEYRPEITYKSRFFGGRLTDEGQWYEGVPGDDPVVKGYIDIIEKALQ